MKVVRAASILALFALALPACDDDTTGTRIADLAGFWNATQFEYDDVTGDAPGFGLDAVADVGGIVTLAIALDGSFTGSVEIPGVTVEPQTGETAPVTIGGILSILDPDTLSIDFDAATEELGLFEDFEAEFTLEAEVLRFDVEETTFDFPEALEEEILGESRGAVAARLRATLVR